MAIDESYVTNRLLDFYVALIERGLISQPSAQFGISTRQFSHCSRLERKNSYNSSADLVLPQGDLPLLDLDVDGYE